VTAESVRDYFLTIAEVDTILVVNSCARGQGVPESDLDFAVLVKPDTSQTEIKKIESAWQIFLQKQPLILKYKQSSPFAHLHLDIIDGNYKPSSWEIGVVSDFFELEIGNQICYSAPMDNAGLYYRVLQKRWLPYYNEELRINRFKMIRKACEYDLNHIPFFVKRELYFHAFDILFKAFQEYLQLLFIANKTYPIAYNKWIKYQITELLKKPEIYPKLSPILSVRNFESTEINEKAKMIDELLNNLK
jgi:predicted nucleotidyltransferase